MGPPVCGSMEVIGAHITCIYPPDLCSLANLAILSQLYPEGEEEEEPELVVLQREERQQA